MLLSEAFNLYSRDVILFRNQSRKTEEHHYVTMNSLINFMGDLNMADVTFEKVRDWKLSLEKRNLAPETVRGYLVRLRAVLRYLQIKGQTALNPELVQLPKRVQRVPGVLSAEEVQRLIDATDKVRNKAIISLLYSTGLRVEELCHLNRRDVEKDYFAVTGKGGKSRLCFIDQRTRSLLDEYLKRRNGYNVYCRDRGKLTTRIRYSVQADANPALFITDEGRVTPGTVQIIFRVARVKAGFDWPVHPHTLRHSFATNMHLNGAPLYAVKEMMGHASLETTAQYLHIWDAQLAEVHHKYHTI